MKIITILVSGIVLLLFFTFFYTYSSDIAAISQVHIELSDVEITKPTFYNVTLTLLMNISNPTERTIQDLSSDFDIYIGSHQIGSGSFSGITIQPKSSTLEPVATIITYKGLAHSIIERLSDFINGQQTTIIIEGTMTAKVFFGLGQTTQDFAATIVTT
ncbi:MAG: hypothetical protein QCH96_03915 [Candidatus Thermoplasmatota archaeon]|nr:hypothetical protein [Candidatus Thermoplasmatota archaeon]